MRRYKVRVVPFSGLDGLVAEQQLHSANVFAVRQQLRSKGIAKSVRAGRNLGEFSNPVDGAPQVLGAGGRVAVARPEKVFGADGRNGVECSDHIFVNPDLERGVIFHDAQSKMAGLTIKRRSAQARDIADAQATVEKDQDKGAGALSSIGGFSGIVARHQIAGGQQLIDLLSGEGQCGDSVYFWRFDPFGGILRAPVAVLAPGEKGPQTLQFIAVGARLDFAGGEEGFDHRSVDCAHQASPEGFLENSQPAGVELDRGFPEIPFAAGVQIAGNCFRHADARAISGLSLILPGALKNADPVKRTLPVVRSQRLANRPAIGQMAVDPDRACAQGVALAFCTVLATPKMTAVRSKGRDHRLPILADPHADMYTDLYTQNISVQVVYFKAYFSQGQMGIVCSSNYFSQQLVDSVSHLNNTEHWNT